MEHQLFRCKTRAIFCLKTHASWMNPRRVAKDLEKGIEQRKRHSVAQQSGIRAPIVQDQAWGAGPLFGKVALETGKKSCEAGALSLHPDSEQYNPGLCTYLINGSAARFSPKLAGALLNVFLDSLPKMKLAAGSQ